MGAKDRQPRGIEAAIEELRQTFGDKIVTGATMVWEDKDPKSYGPKMQFLAWWQRLREFEQKQKKGQGGPDYQVIFTKREKGYDPALDPTHPCNQRRQLPARPAAAGALKDLAPHHVKAPVPVLETPEGEPLEVVDDD